MAETLPRRVELASSYSPIALRTYVEPEDWSPNAHRTRAVPGVGLIVHSVARDEPGEPAAFWLYALVAPPLGELLSRRGFALPDSEPALIGAAYRWNASAREIEGLTRACALHGLEPPIPQRELARLVCEVCWKDRATFAGFHVPLEFGRLSVHSSRAARKPGRGGIVVTVATVPGKPWRRQALCENGEIQDMDLPRIAFLPIDRKRVRTWFKPVPEALRWDGVFASLQPLAEALGSGPIDTILEACEAFDVSCPPAVNHPSFSQALGELRAECCLYRVLLERHLELCPDEPPTPHISSGTYARAFLRRIGLTPPLRRWPNFPKDVLASTKGAYYAGEVAVHVRGTRLPVRALDFGGAYAIAASLIGAWDVLAAEELPVEEVPPEEAASMLRRAVAEFGAFCRGGPSPSPEAWKTAAWMTVLIEPRGEVLPHRPRQGETSTAIRAPLDYRNGQAPWQAPDLIVHLLGGGSMPTITRAFGLVPKGRVPLLPTTLPGGRTFDPSREDLAKTLLDERGRVTFDPSIPRRERRRLRNLLKGITVSLFSGLPVQVNDDEPTRGKRAQHVFDPRTGTRTVIGVHVLETPGDWYLAPVGAAVTATARLLLHLVIEMVHRAGGTVAYWDTDSVLIVALPDGGLVPCPGGPERMPDGSEAARALSFAEVEDIRRRVDELLPAPPESKPYADGMDEDGNWVRTCQPARLRLEPQNFDGPSGFRSTLYAAPRASKKAHLYRTEHVGSHIQIIDGKPRVIGPTPEEESRPHSLRMAKASEHGLPFDGPKDDPAWRVTGYENILRTDWELPAEFPSAWDLPAVMEAPVSTPEILKRHPQARPFCRLGVGQVHLGGEQVVAPVHRGFDPTSADWRDPEGNLVVARLPRTSLLRTLGAAQRKAWNAVDRRAVGPDGDPPGRTTEGVIRPLPTIASRARIIGKESRHLGIGRGVLEEPEYMDYGGDDELPSVIEAARRLSKDSGVRWHLIQEIGVSEREFAYLLARKRAPRPGTRDALVDAVGRAARNVLLRSDPLGTKPQDSLDLIAVFLDTPEPELRCKQCGKALIGRQRNWCTDACRKRASRNEQLMLDEPSRD